MNQTWTNIIIDILLVVYVMNCLFMWLVIMMQRSKQEGLGAAFGGGLTESVFGAQTSNVLVKATVWATILFFVISVSLARLYSHRTAMLDKPSTVQQELAAKVPSATLAPAPVAPTNSTLAPGAPAAPATTPIHSPTWDAPTSPMTQPPVKSSK